MPYDNANEVVNELFEPLLSKYQIGLETSMRGNNFIFDSVQLFYFKCHSINFERGGSYTDCPNWIKQKKATAIPKSDDDRYFQYATLIALNHEERVLESHSERVSKTKPFINSCN